MSLRMRGVRRSAVGEPAAMSHLDRPPAGGGSRRERLRCTAIAAGAEVNPGGLTQDCPFGSRDLEEFRFLEVEHQGDDRRGKRLHAPVVILNVRVVEAAGRLDTVLGVGEFALQGEEVLVRLQLGVILGHREQPAEGLDEWPLGGGLSSWRLPTGGGGGGSGVGDPFEYLAFVRSVSFDGLDEVGDQVVAPAQFGVDVRERVLDQVPLADEPVVGDGQAESRQHGHRGNDPNDHVDGGHEGLFSPSARAGGSPGGLPPLGACCSVPYSATTSRGMRSVKPFAAPNKIARRSGSSCSHATSRLRSRISKANWPPVETSHSIILGSISLNANSLSAAVTWNCRLKSSDSKSISWKPMRSASQVDRVSSWTET